MASIGISADGMLEHDRSFALFEENGSIINAKNYVEIHQLHAQIDIQTWQARFRIHGQPGESQFHLDKDQSAINQWFSDYFERSVQLQRNRSMGFVDDLTATGPTLISTATLETVASWFDGISVEELRLRLRTNIEIAGVPAFWEDQLYGPTEGEPVRFRIGDEVELLGKNACQRCPVPTRDVKSGEATSRFAKIFTTQRKATLPPWAHPERFDHYYRVAINTIPGENIPAGATLSIGDALEIIGERFPPT